MTTDHIITEISKMLLEERKRTLADAFAEILKQGTVLNGLDNDDYYLDIGMPALRRIFEEEGDHDDC